DAQLLIIGDGDERIDDLIPSHPRITYLHYAERQLLGKKYNTCCSLAFAKTDWVALWADDDWHAPWR
ncbi:MAG: hypothetical protein GTO41_02325, partial [Burkholderiales bacterium]|nr:hypothetical protein [Burkholderiales bacterium]